MNILVHFGHFPSQVSSGRAFDTQKEFYESASKSCESQQQSDNLSKSSESKTSIEMCDEIVCEILDQVEVSYYYQIPTTLSVSTDFF